ncbi:hypothetical protein JCM3775_003369 [Rhodotorula graminis]
MQHPVPLAGSEPQEFPFAAHPSSSSPYPSPRPSPIGDRRRSSMLATAAPASPSPVVRFGIDAETVRRHEAEQVGYADKRQALVESLDETQGLVKGLAAFNQDKWTIHYPHQLGVSTVDAPAPHRASSSAAPQTPPRSAVKGARQAPLRRSASLFQEEVPAAAAAAQTQAQDDATATAASSARPVPQRAFSVADTAAAAALAAATTTKDTTPVAPAHPLSILSLDLKMGHPSTSASQLPALIPSLSLSTLSQLLSRRLTTSLGHLSQLRARVIDPASRVLVTGDLNAGKSTLVNALLRRDVMPWDQQPCTTVFCEVVDAGANAGVEELHAIRDVALYDAKDPATYDRFALDDVYDVQDSGDTYQLVKAFVHDARAPVVDDAPEHDDESVEREQALNPSLLKNGLVDISLIDAPGLNRDTLSTTALFARQSEIDVIVFVVSAENHFTLSAKEFLWNASREKAYVFIVVNKWGGIRDKARCMRVVGEQIKQLSPATWDNRAELVHFVDAADHVDADEPAPSPRKSAHRGAAAAAAAAAEDDDEPSAFDHLEQSLRSFVLLKRTKSKLAPAKHYLLNLLADLSTLASSNVVAANAELRAALAELERIRPVHERLSAQRDEVEEGVDRVEEGVVAKVQGAAWARLERALGFVAEGKVVPPLEAAPASADADADAASPATATATALRQPDSFDGPAALPPYPGLMGLWDWAAEVKRTLVLALEAEVRAAEDAARTETVQGVHTVVDELGDRYLPEEAHALAQLSTDEQREVRKERTFRPEVMFAKRRRGVGRLAARGGATGLGLGSAGLGVTWTAGDFDVSFVDLFDLERMVGHGNALRGGRKAHTKLLEDDVVEKGTVIGLGLGSIGMVGSRIIGIKGTMGSVTRIIEMLGSKSARKWAGPVIGVLTVGLVAYVIVDLPRAIPRNIGRKLALSLSAPDASATSSSSTPSSQPASFASAHSDRIAREVRKVLRLAGWDLRERFRAALDKAAGERREVEGVVKRAEGALAFLEEFEGKVAKRDEAVKLVEL